MRRDRQSKREHQPTVGGQKIRALRKKVGLTLLDIESIPNPKMRLTAAHLHKIEVGDIKKPDYETLDMILTALNTRYIERRAVLEAFGYKAPMDLPTEDEINEAVELCQHEMNDATYPIYIIDIGQRIWAWNRYMPRLIGKHPDDPDLTRFRGITVLDLALNPQYGGRVFLENPGEYLPAMLQLIKTGIEPFREEAWHEDLITRARQFPGFSELWDNLQANPVERFATQSIIPAKLSVPNSGVLQFRLSNMNFFLDPRFNMIHFTPFGATTLRQCALWAEEEGVV